MRLATKNWGVFTTFPFLQIFPLIPVVFVFRKSIAYITLATTIELFLNDSWLTWIINKYKNVALDVCKQ